MTEGQDLVRRIADRHPEAVAELVRAVASDAADAARTTAVHRIAQHLHAEPEKNGLCGLLDSPEAEEAVAILGFVDAEVGEAVGILRDAALLACALGGGEVATAALVGLLSAVAVTAWLWSSIAAGGGAVAEAQGPHQGPLGSGATRRWSRTVAPD